MIQLATSMGYLSSVALAVIAIFTPIAWTIIFLQTYSHYQKMEKKKRIRISVVNATEVALLVAIISYLAVIFIIEKAVQ